MRWRPFTWLLLTVRFFVAAGFFWRLGDEWAARNAPPPAPSSVTNNPDAPKKLAKPSAGAAPFHLLSQSANLKGSPAGSIPKAQQNARLPNRLSNTTKSFKELQHSDSAILLQNALIDTKASVPLAIPEHLRAHSDPGSYIVQSRGPLDDAFRAMLKEAGASLVSSIPYIPNNAYLVHASAAVAQRVAAAPQAQAVQPWE